MSGDSVEFDDFYLPPTHLEGAGSLPYSMNLKANESLGVTLQFRLISQIGDEFIIDPNFDVRALGQHSITVPLTVLEMLVRFTFVRRSHPTTGRLAVKIAGLGTILPTGFDLDLRAIHSPLRTTLSLRTNLHTGVKLVIHLNFEDQIEVGVFLVGAEEGVRAALIGFANYSLFLNPICGGAVALGPAFEGFPIEDGFVFFICSNQRGTENN